MNYTIEMFGSFVFLLFAFSFLACYAQRLSIQYRLDKLKETREKDIAEKLEMIDKSERIIYDL